MAVGVGNAESEGSSIATYRSLETVVFGIGDVLQREYLAKTLGKCPQAIRVRKVLTWRAKAGRLQIDVRRTSGSHDGISNGYVACGNAVADRGRDRQPR